ncbi:restriction endonuclease [Flavobacterium sp. 7A]|uniref:restriction endonuclease n=1 Tax=Flavobacterium sp. 7A TaxID=2940571 RepID=UPI00222805A4|nr:restriction endonuclease [Flavobacterium sp. 7A]MCW2120728.1 hypothetical protein [Flavobacterium sp. 7A]
MYIESDLKVIQGIKLTIIDFPKNLFFDLHSSDGFGTFFFYELEVGKVDNDVVFLFRSNQPNKYWEGKWGLSTFLGGLNEIINDKTEAEVHSLDIEDDYKEIEVKFICNVDFEFHDQISKYAKLLNQYIKNTERLLSGVVWQKEFETNEKLFCTELLYPLLRKMNFIDVRFTHGTREYGKDFTFSEIPLFGNLRHYAIQAKAGNVRGNVKSEIDEIIGQLDDAFSMPYFEVSVNENRLINTFIVAISGNFTENAKDKISQKIPTNLKGSIYFLDREKILELIEKYWK